MQGKEILKNIWKPVGIFLIGVFIGLMINIPSCSSTSKPQIIKVPVRDTILIDSIQIKEKTKIIYKTTVDTFYIKEKGDTVYLNDLPVEHKTYKDTIKTDSTSTEINIDYHGFSSGIDRVSLIHNYYNTTHIVSEQKKLISPFVFVEGGPKFDQVFQNVKGVKLGVGAGIYIKDSWGVGASYNLDIGDKLGHDVKLQVYKKF